MLRKFIFIFCCLCVLKVSAQNNLDYLKKAFSNKDSSDYYFGKAKSSIKDKADEAEYYFCKNAFCTDYGKEDSALYYGKIALQKFALVGDTLKPLYIYSNIAKVYKAKGQYQKAISELFKGLKFAQRYGNIKWQGWYNQGISLNYHDFGDYAKGIAYGKKAYEILKKDTANVMNAVYALNAIAINFDDWNKPDSALYYHKKSLVYENETTKNKIDFVYNNIGNTLLKTKKYAEALPYITKSIAITKNNMATKPDAVAYYQMATSCTNLARIYYELKDYNKALTIFKEAETYIVQSHSAEKAKDYDQLGVELNKATGNYKAALAHSEKYNLLRDSIFKKDNAKAMAEVEAQYQVAEKEKNLLAERLKSTRKTNWILLLSALITGAIVIAYLIYRQQKLKNRQQEQEFKLKSAIKEIETQNKLHEQRLDISRDLHDNIGAQLTFIISSVDTLKYGGHISDSTIDQQLAKISNFAKETIAELRDTLWAMNADELLFDDIKIRLLSFLDKAKAATVQTEVDFELSPALSQLKISSLKGINIYRAVQEAVNNALKHAQASKITVKVEDNGPDIAITIADNGKGADLAIAPKGNGLYNMKKRILEIGGEFNINAVAGQGTQVHFSIPKNT